MRSPSAHARRSRRIPLAALVVLAACGWGAPLQQAHADGEAMMAGGFARALGRSYPNLTGVYIIDPGVNPSGSRYGGMVTITKQRELRNRYCLKWDIANSSQEEFGCGRLVADGSDEFLLTVDWGASYPVIYRVSRDGRHLKGKWHNGTGIEDLRRK